MRNSKEHRRWGWMLAVVLAGVGVGWLARSKETEQRKDSKQTTMGTDGANASSPADDPSRGRSTARGDEELLSLSREQWGKLVRNPTMLKVTLVDYLPPEVPLLGDIPIIERLFQNKSVNSLEAHAGFFGWSEVQRDRVARALTTFGLDLAEAEKDGTTVDYSEPGRARFDFSASRSRRQQVAAQLRESLEGTLGKQETERFVSLSSMEGLSRDLSDSYELTATRTNDYLAISAPEVKDFIGPDQVDLIKPMLEDSGLDRRIAHLGLPIDWSRLLETAKSVTPAPR